MCWPSRLSKTKCIARPEIYCRTHATRRSTWRAAYFLHPVWSGCPSSVTGSQFTQSKCTYVVEPDDLVGLRPGRDGALEVDVVALGDVVRIEAGAQVQPHHGGICNGAHSNWNPHDSCYVWGRSRYGRKCRLSKRVSYGGRWASTCLRRPTRGSWCSLRGKSASCPGRAALAGTAARSASSSRSTESAEWMIGYWRGIRET